MINRYRWYRATFKKDAAEVEAALLSHKRSSHRDWFELIERARSQTSWRFWWQSEVSVTRVNENGESESELLPTVHSSDFVLLRADGRWLIRFVNPKRNMSPLLNSIGIALSHGFSVDPITFTKKAPDSVLQKVDASKITGLKITNVVVAKDTVGRFEFVSKSGLNESSLKFLSKMQYMRDQVSYELTYKGVKGQMTYSSNGTVKISGGLAPRILHFVEKDLTKF